MAYSANSAAQPMLTALHRWLPMLVVMLVVLALVSGQALAQQHLHLDETQEVTCVVCAQTDSGGAILNAPPGLPLAANYTNHGSTHTPSPLRRTLRCYQSRAPPQI